MARSFAVDGPVPACQKFRARRLIQIGQPGLTGTGFSQQPGRCCIPRRAGLARNLKADGRQAQGFRQQALAPGDII